MKTIALGHYAQPDVLVTSTHVRVAMDGGRLVRLDRAGNVLDVTTLAASIKPKFAGGRWLATQAPDDAACTLRDLVTGAVRDLGPSAGEIATNARYVAWKDLHGLVWRAALPDGEPKQVRTSTAAMGLAYVDDDDSVWDWDEARLRFGLLNARPCGDAWVGEGVDSGLTILRAGLVHTLATGETCIMPRGSYCDGLYAIVAWDGNPSGQVRLWLLTADEIDALPLVPVPPPIPPPVVSLRVPVVYGSAPLSVRCSVTCANATTWRWLLDGAIVGSDGSEHVYQITSPGQHAIAVRAAGPGGTSQTPDVDVTVDAPAPPPVGYYGLSTGIQQPTDPAILAELKMRGWEVARYDVMPAPGQNRRASTPEEIAEIVRRARAVDLSPLILCLASQVGDVPESCDVELRAFPDLSKGGLEPNFDKDHTPVEYAEEINRWLPVARQRRQRVWVLAGNTGRAALQWLAKVLLELEPDVGVSLHPYPLGSAREWYDRSAEIAAFKQVVGLSAMLSSECRPWIVGEWGWQQGPIPDAPRSILQKILAAFGWKMPTHWHIADEDQAACVRKDFETWKAAGARLACLYQILDGAPCAKHPQMPATAIEGYGIRRADGTWKPVSTVPQGV